MTDWLTLAERCRRIQLLLLDVDGVLTEGGIHYAADASEEPAPQVLEGKRFHVRDGLGLKLWREAGKGVALLSGRVARVVLWRAAELRIPRVIQGSSDKGAAFTQLIQELHLQPEQVAFVGDDVIDLPVLRQCGLAVAVADANPVVLQAAHLITQRPGGQSAVREVIERILRCQGCWQG